jgi:hypothetical protein
MAMSMRLEQAWRAWRGLNQTERSQFLHLFRRAYQAEREAAREAQFEAERQINIAVRHYRIATCIDDIVLSEADFQH